MLKKLFMFLLLISAAVACKKPNQPRPDVCVDKSKITRTACPDIYAPVCGCNGVTYNNECDAKRNGVVKWTSGPCKQRPGTGTGDGKGDGTNGGGTTDGCIDKTRITNEPCTKEYKPVCGCNGVTYANECEAKRNGVVKWAAGPCGSKDPGTGTGDGTNGCIDKSKISSEPCTTEYKPVCGCDGKTYSNPCSAERAGVVQYKEGPCGGR